MLAPHDYCRAEDGKKSSTFLCFCISFLNCWKSRTFVQRTSRVICWGFSLPQWIDSELCLGISPLFGGDSRIGWNLSRRRSSPNPGRDGALAGSASLPQTTGSGWASRRLRKRGRGAGAVGYAWRAHGQTNCTSVCPERRGEWAPSSSRLTEGSTWAGCCDEECPPTPALCVRLGSSGVCLLPSAKQLPFGRRGWGGVWRWGRKNRERRGPQPRQELA